MKTDYILFKNGTAKAVISAENQKELGQKTALAVQTEEQTDDRNDNSVQKTYVQFPEYMGDWGEDTQIVAVYVQNGFLITDTDYTLMKCISY